MFVRFYSKLFSYVLKNVIFFKNIYLIIYQIYFHSMTFLVGSGRFDRIRIRQKGSVPSGSATLFFFDNVRYESLVNTDLMDTYGASLSVLVVAVAEIVFIMWLYGVQRLFLYIYFYIFIFIQLFFLDWKISIQVPVPGTSQSKNVLGAHSLNVAFCGQLLFHKRCVHERSQKWKTNKTFFSYI